MSSPERFYRDAYAALEQGLGHPPASEPTFERRVKAALKVIGPTPKRVLDFGCGAGDAALRFVQHGHHVVGVDVSESGVRLAKANVPAAEFTLIQSEARVPLPDGSFDVCFCSEVVEHVFEMEGLLHEVSRLLAPSGLFILTTPYHGWVKNLLVITFAFERHFNPASGHIRFFSRRSITESLRAGGFDVERIRGIGRVWPLWKSMFVVARKHG